MTANAKTAILAAFAADSLALGVHWIYDIATITKRYGRVTTLIKPELANYHVHKEAGDQTHYGDQMLWLLRHVIKNQGFDPQIFITDWQNHMRSYDGYQDQASRQTLTALDAGQPWLQSGSTSADLSGAARLAPLLLLTQDSKDLVAMARAQAQLTHNSPLVLGAAELLARTSLLVMQETLPSIALEQAAQDTGDLMIIDLVRQGLAARDQETTTAISTFGQNCAVMSALPSAVQVVTRYADDFENALVENVMAGGDNAARGMFIATILGARPKAQIPVKWLQDLRCYPELQKLLA